MLLLEGILEQYSYKDLVQSPNDLTCNQSSSAINEHGGNESY